MSLSTWIVFTITEIVLCLTPGPAVLFVVSQGLRYGGRKSLWANAGILAGNTAYFVLSAIGLTAIIATSQSLFTAIKYAGAAYLVILGILTILGRGAALGQQGGDPARVHGASLLGRGFILQAANPKALVFFTALLPQFVNPSGSVAMQMVILGVTSVVVEFFVLAAYGIGAGRAAAAAANPRFARAANYASGGLLIAAGTGLALARES